MTTPPPLPQQIPQPRCTCRTFGMYLGVMLLSMIMVFFASAVVTYVMPKKFESTAMIQVRPSATDQHNSNQPLNFLATELDVIRSQMTLKEVARQLQLSTRWNMPEEDAVAVLQKMVEVENISGTDLIEIRVSHTGPEDARDIAKEIYEAYKKRREGKVREMQEEGLKEFEKAIINQSVVVEEKRALYQKYILFALNDSTNDEKMRKSQKEYETEQSMYDRMKEKIALESINLKQPLNLVELHEEPLVGQFPCSPNVTLNLLLGAAGGFALGLVISLLMRLFQGRCKRCSA